MDVLIGIIVLLVMYIVIPAAIIGGTMRLLTPRGPRASAEQRTAEARGEARRP
jgi:hypothetical protein